MIITVIIIVIGFGIVAFFHITDLKRRRWWRELAGVSFLLLLGFVFSMLLCFKVKLPFVSEAITRLIRSSVGM